MNKKHKLVISFHRKDDMLDFARRFMPEGTAVYHGDALDHEFNGVVPANSYVLRHKGEKPDPFLAKHKKIGA